MIDAQTQLYGIIGNPVRHSLSPIIHNGAFRRMGLNAVYLAFEVKNLKEAITGIRGLGIRGVSVTIPFKTEVIPLLDVVDDVARRIGAVNTIVNEGERLIGYNTDWTGAVEALEEKVDIRGKKVVLLGAGGSARAIAFGLKERGCQVIIVNRSEERSELLAKELGLIHWPPSSIEELEGDIVINTTSVGMFPDVSETPFSKVVLKKGMTVMDIVYRPLWTRFLQEAEQRGCVTIDGLEMLVHQGAAQLEIWTGKKPEIGQIKEDLRQAMKREESHD
ncbi:MAG: shikimate dehydrogenase [Deltaproteobacteria bacterium]|nr:shikimate dehydrogenase [Deltaproteobacteria bacterium]